MKKKSWVRKLIIAIIGIVIGIAGRWLMYEFSDFPAYLSYGGLIYASYFGGPLVGSVVAVITAAFGIIYRVMLKGPVTLLVKEISFTVPMLITAVMVGVMSKNKKFFDSIPGTIEMYVNISLIRTLGMMIAGVVSNDASFGMYMPDLMVSYYRDKMTGQIAQFIAPSAVVMFTDTFVTMLLTYIIIFIHRKALKHNTQKKFRSKNILDGIIIALPIMAAVIGINSVKAEAMDSSNFVQRVYNSSNGLLGGAANDIVQTDDGTIWIATYGGVYTFDGDTFTLLRDMPLARSADEIFVDKNGNLWISTNGTGLVVRTANDDVYALTEDDGLPSNTVEAVVQADDTTFYVGTVAEVAIVKYENGILAVTDTISGMNNIVSMGITSDGYLVARDYDGIIYTAKDGEIVDTKDFGETIRCLTVTATDEIFLGGEEADLFYGFLDEGKITGFKERKISELDTIFGLMLSSDNVLYVAGNDKVGYFNADADFSVDGSNAYDYSMVFSVINTGDFNNAIDSIMEDYQGDIWFTSTRCGLLELCPSSFTNLFDVCNAESVVTNTVTEWKGYLYVGTDSGLVILNENRSISITNELTLQFEKVRIRCIDVDKKNHLWFTTQNNGIYEVVSSDEIYNYTTDNGLPNNRSRSLIFLSDGSTLASTDSGMVIIKNHEVTDIIDSADGMKETYALNMLQADDDTVLVGTNGDGIAVLKNGKVERFITQKDGLCSGVILRMAKDTVGTGYFVLSGSGLCYLYDDYTVKEFTEFPYYNNTDIFQINRDKIVILSTAGIYICNYNDLMTFGYVSCTHLDEKMGLPGSVTSNAWNYLTDDGILYFAGNTGVYKLNCYDYDIAVDEYKLNLSSYKIDDGASQTLLPGEKIYMPEGSERLELEFDIFNYTTTKPYVRYYMSGVDNNKTTVAAEVLKELMYFDIGSGEHTIYLEVLDSTQTRVIDIYSYTIVREQESYEKLSFKIYYYLGMILVAVSIVAYAIIVVVLAHSRKQKNKYNITLQQLEKEKAEALEKSLKQEEAANKSKSDFLANMSHEIRTPINAVIGMDTMILRESNQESIKGYAQNIYSAGNTLLSLINDILDFSKIESGKMELVLGDYDLGKAISDLVTMIKPKAEGKQLSLDVKVNPDIPNGLYGDEIRVKQVILNILNNAVKYTEKGGIQLKVDYEQVDPSNIALRVSVSDTGIGIKEEDLSKLFSPFERIEEHRNKNIEGTGLGMSITKNLLALMDSRLEVSSVYGEGSTFAFTILQPVRSAEKIGNYEDHKSGDELLSDTENFHAPDANILVVDDVEMNLIVVRNLLKRIKIGVETADSGKKAIEMAKEKKYDIIFLDSMMPVMNGEETLHHIKDECEENAGTPIIMLTAHAIKGAREEYLEKGFDNYLAKPVDGRKLEAMIQNYLPDDKIIPAEEDENASGSAEGENSDSENAGSALSEDEIILSKIRQIPGVEMEKGIETAGGQDTYLVVARNFYDTAGMRISMLKEYYAGKDVDNYTIQVHALKSSARLIGAYGLSEKAWELEQAGRASDMETIEAKTESVISEYEELQKNFGDVYGAGEAESETEEDTREAIDPDEFVSNLKDMRELLEAFDFETARDLFASLDEYRLPDDFAETAVGIRAQLGEVNRDGVLELLNKYLEGK